LELPQHQQEEFQNCHMIIYPSLPAFGLYLQKNLMLHASISASGQ